MRCARSFWLSSFVVVAIVSQAGAAEPPPSIAKWFAQNCLECHGAGEKHGGLDLTRRQRALDGGDSGPSLVPGRPDESLIWQRVAAGEMPPKRPLGAADKKTLRDWLAAGAPWDRDPIDPFEFSGSRRGGRDWWSLQPLARVVPPDVPGARRPATMVDAFLMQRLAAASLAPSPAADRRTLIRRLAFDLTGLPPTPEESAEFEADEGPDAYERLTDRLLASPRYGERWARHWLDVAHFGESDGFEYDRLRPNSWPYRDWTIDAFNRDLPYDQFARLQIAGDLLAPDDASAITATGFLVGGAHDHLQPAVELMRQIMRQDELEDLVGTLGQTFLGLTLHCARCHDHKFDAVSQTEYYRIASALSGVRRGERALPPSGDAAAARSRLEPLRADLARLESEGRRRALAKRRPGASPDEPAPPQPIAAWDFTRDLRDRIGVMHGTAHGGARQTPDGLTLDGAQAYVSTAPLAKPLRAKTLAAVVRLSNLEQRGGGVVSLQTLDGGLFDAIVFGEREPGRWMAGSNGFVRTGSFQGPAETRAERPSVHVAIAYDEDGTIRGYVDGRQYGEPYKTGLQPFSAGEAQVVFGLRHAPVGGNRMLAGVVRNAALFDRALTAAEVAAAARSAGDLVTEDELAAQLDSDERRRREALKAEAAGLQERLRTAEVRKTFAITPGAAAVQPVLLRGSPAQPGPVATPGGIGAIRGVDAEFGLPADAPEGERRRRLADWVASRDNPLFARTIVNRLWHYHFGQGLIATPNDLGFNGGEPTHPELLDRLADELVQRDFSLKALHRSMITSDAYRQSSAPRADAGAVDADNRLVWRMAPRRLEAEAVRDAILAAAGELNLQAGGPGFQDFRPFLRGGTQFYEPLDPVGPAFQRRSIYRTWARGGHNALLDTFDCPDPSTTTPRRSVTTTPLQALSLMNHSFVLRMADRFAERLQIERPDDVPGAVTRAFELACGRPPDEVERGAAEPFVRAHGLAAFCRVLLNGNAFVYVD